jgi:hypothetical protein
MEFCDNGIIPDQNKILNHEEHKEHEGIFSEEKKEKDKKEELNSSERENHLDPVIHCSGWHHKLCGGFHSS